MRALVLSVSVLFYVLAAADEELDRAIAAAEKRLREEPGTGSVCLELALLHGLAGHREAAERMLVDGITLSSGASIAQAEERIRIRAIEEPEPAILHVRDRLAVALESKAKCAEAQRVLSSDWKQALELCEQALSLCPENAEVYLQRGWVHLDSFTSDALTLGDLFGHDPEARARALADFTRAIELCPVYADAYLARAELQDDRGELFLLGTEAAVPDEVMADVEKAVELQPHRAPGYRMRAALFARKHGEALARSSEADPYDRSFEARARADFARVIELEPASVDAYLERARFELEVYDTVAALADLDKILQELEPGNLQALELRYEQYDLHLQWEELVAALTRLIGREPASKYLDLRGETHLRLAAPDLALSDFDASLAAAEENAARVYDNPGISQEAKDELAATRGAYAVRAHVGRGRALAAQGRTEEAFAAFARAEELDAQSAEPHCARGELHQALGDAGKAQAAFERALELADVVVKNGPKARIELLNALYFLAQRDTEQALEAARQAAYLDERYTAAVALEAQLLLELQDYGRALDPLDNWIALAPRDANAYAARGRLRYVLNETEPARADFARAVELRPDDPRIWSAYGELEFQAGDFRKAIACFEKVTALVPEHGATKLVLAVLHALVEDTDAARRVLTAGLALATPEELRHVAGVAAEVLKQRPDSALLAEIAAKLAEEVARKP